MFIDKQNLFDEDLALTVTANSTNIIDLGNDSSRVQVLNEKAGKLFIQVTTAFASVTSLTVTLHGDNSSGFGTNTELVSSPTILLAELVAGYEFQMSLPLIQYQYLRLTYTIVTTGTGSLTAGIILDKQTNV